MSIHHNIPKSMGGANYYGNTSNINDYQHQLFHTTYHNRTPKSAILSTCNMEITNMHPYIRENLLDFIFNNDIYIKNARTKYSENHKKAYHFALAQICEEIHRLINILNHIIARGDTKYHKHKRIIPKSYLALKDKIGLSPIEIILELNKAAITHNARQQIQKIIQIKPISSPNITNTDDFIPFIETEISQQKKQYLALQEDKKLITQFS